MRETTQSVGRKLDAAIALLKEIRSDAKAGVLPIEFAERIERELGGVAPAAPMAQVPVVATPLPAAPRIDAAEIRAAVAAEIAKLPTTELPLKGGAKLKVLTVP